MESFYQELTYEKALEMYHRYKRTILVGTTPHDFYSTNEIRNKRSLDQCIKQYLNYNDGPVRFFLDQRTAECDMKLYRDYIN